MFFIKFIYLFIKDNIKIKLKVKILFLESFNKNIETSSSQITDNDRKADSLRQQIAELEEERVELLKELAAITEDIVSMLDAKLKDAGFSEGALRLAKEELEQNFAKLKIYLDGRKNIFSDQAAKKLNADEAAKTIAESV